MVSTWSSGATYQTSSFQSGFDNEQEQGGLTFVDFLPECRKTAGIFTSAEYETFRSLIDRANDWLRANPSWEIKTCESVEFKDKGNAIDSEKMVYLEYGERSTWYIRGLRLWISKKKSDNFEAQQIGYMNLVPEKLKDGGLFSSPTFESLDDIIDKFNSTSNTRPIPGKIITIESQEMKMNRFKDQAVDPDKSSWVERGTRSNEFLFIIRIFYEIAESYSEEIGIKDFVPDLLEHGGLFSLPKYELFSSIVEKASDWCSQQTDLKICNAQSLEIKIKRGTEVNTQNMYYFEHGNATTFYVRVLRVTYTKPSCHVKWDTISKLSCKTFVPIQLTDGIFIPDFESLQETKERIKAWTKATGVRVISAETTIMNPYGWKERKYGPEATVTSNVGNRNQFSLYVFRIYCRGVYVEPPLEALPPIPPITRSSCCCIL